MNVQKRCLVCFAVSRVVEAKTRGRRIAVVTGSGPNIHEGVTTLIAELMDKGIVDGVTTSSAVINHEMSGALDRVKMCNAPHFGFDKKKMPRGNLFEFTELTDEEIDVLRKEMFLDEELLKKSKTANGLVPRRNLYSNLFIGDGDDVWMPATVYPVLRYGTGMTSLMMISNIVTQFPGGGGSGSPASPPPCLLIILLNANWYYIFLSVIISSIPALGGMIGNM
jgi:hypothetical protein